MTLVDTSVWVDHFRKDNPSLTKLLVDGKVAVHPFIIGELACGNLKNRAEILHLLNELPQSTMAEHHEVLSFIEANKLYGTGIGWIDAHLIASALLTDLKLFTYDTAIGKAASKLGIEYKERNLG
jgi:predicted nucleic acid-binding protein